MYMHIIYAINWYFHCLQKKRMDFAEVSIDQRFHKHIIGKAGQNSKLDWSINHSYGYGTKKRFQRF